MTALMNDLERLVRTPLTINSLEQLESMLKEIIAWRDEINTPPQGAADIIIHYALNSTVVATGNIKVIGDGCYHTRLQAGKAVAVHGVFRGGEIQAQGDVYIKELGSRTGTSTRVETQAGAAVTIAHAFENTSIRIGSRQYSFVQEEWGVRLWLDREGNLARRNIPAS
ncbi:FapA family protein [Neomoorella glycerini]|nr:FapA family protein [Moorella glycerini]